jgi:surface antigen
VVLGLETLQQQTLPRWLVSGDTASEFSNHLHQQTITKMKKVFSTSTLAILIVLGIATSCKESNLQPQSENQPVVNFSQPQNDLEEAAVNTSNPNARAAACVQCVGYVRTRMTLPSKDLTKYSVKKAICNAWTPKAGYAVIMPSSLFPDYGHIAYVSKVVDSNTLLIDEANWGIACGITTGVKISISKRNVYGYYKP